MTLFERANQIMQDRHGEGLRSRQIEALADATEELIFELHSGASLERVTRKSYPMYEAERLKIVRDEKNHTDE